MNDCRKFSIRILYPTAGIIGSGFSLVSGLILYLNPDSNDSDKELGLVRIICGASILGASSLIMAGGIYEHNARPFFSLLPREEVTYHCSLSSLYAAISILEPDDCAAEFGSGLYAEWLLDRKGFTSWLGCRREKTLSQLLL